MHNFTDQQFLHSGALTRDGYVRDKSLDSQTTRSYVSKDRILQFDIHDGHLAWNYSRITGKTNYRCECILKAQQKLGVTLEELVKMANIAEWEDVKEE